jgi:hypothetical protein
MVDENVQIRVGFVPDTSNNNKAIAEINKVKQEVLDVQEAIKETSATKLNITETAGNIGGAAGKVRGIAGLIGGAGGGEIAGLINDIGDAVEGVSQFGGALTALVPGLTGGAAGAAAMLVPLLPLAAIAAAVAGAVVLLNNAENERAEALRQEMDIVRSINDEIAAGSTKEDIQAQIEQLRFRSELEKSTLEESKQKYNDYIESIRNAFGGLGRIIEPFVRLFGNYEEELSSQVNTSQDLIDGNTQKEELYAAALEKGLTAKNDAAKAEDELARERDKAQKEAQKAADKATRDQEKQQREAEAAQQKAQQEAEAAAKEQAQLQQQQTDMQIKNADAIKKINQSALDSIQDIQRKAADSVIDGRNKFASDLNSMSQKFHDGELDAEIKANRAEQAALKDHKKTIQGIIDNAADAEENAREQRNFIDFARAQREAQKELNKQPAEFDAGKQEREMAAQQERDDRLRAFELARRDRKQAFDEEGVQRQTATERALRDGQIAKQRQWRDQQIGYQSEQATFQRHLQSMLAVRGQFQNAEMQLLQANLNAVTGGGNRPAPAAPSSVFNSSQTISNSTINMTTIGMGSTMQGLRAAGFAR